MLERRKGKFKVLRIIRSEWLIRVRGMGILAAECSRIAINGRRGFLIGEEKGTIKSDLSQSCLGYFFNSF